MRHHSVTIYIATCECHALRSAGDHRQRQRQSLVCIVYLLLACQRQRPRLSCSDKTACRLLWSAAIQPVARCNIVLAAAHGCTAAPSGCCAGRTPFSCLTLSASRRGSSVPARTDLSPSALRHSLYACRYRLCLPLKLSRMPAPGPVAGYQRGTHRLQSPPLFVNGCIASVSLYDSSCSAHLYNNVQ